MGESQLETIRKARGLTLEDISSKTRIGIKYLTAIEEGNFALLPPPVYTKGFIKTYADILGIDRQVIIGDYEKHLLATLPAGASDPVREVKAKGLGDTKRPFNLRLPGLKSGRFLGIVLITGLLGYLIWVASASFTSNEPPVASPPGALAPEAGSAAGSPTKGQILPDQQEPGKAGPAGGLPLVIEARELTWLRITSDGNPPSELLLKAGERIERSAAEYFIIHIGNAGGVTLRFQGKKLGPLGAAGEVVHLRLP